MRLRQAVPAHFRHCNRVSRLGHNCNARTRGEDCQTYVQSLVNCIRFNDRSRRGEALDARRQSMAHAAPRVPCGHMRSPFILGLAFPARIDASALLRESNS